MSSSEQEIRFRVHGHSWNYSPVIQINFTGGDNFLGVIGDQRTTLEVETDTPITWNPLFQNAVNGIDFLTYVLGTSYDEMYQRIIEEQSAQEQDLQRDDSVDINVKSQRYDTTVKANNSCPICMEQFGNSDMVTEIVKCGHIVCTSCVKEWAKYNAICPLCRNPL